MPFPSRRHDHDHHHPDNSHSAAAGLGGALLGAVAVAAPASGFQRLGAAPDPSLQQQTRHTEESSSSSAGAHTMDPHRLTTPRDPSAPMSAPNSEAAYKSPHSHRASAADLRMSSNPPLPYTPQHHQSHDAAAYANAPALNLHQASPHGSQSSSVVPSNANSGVPGALQPAGGAHRPTPSQTSSSSNVPTMSIQTNAQQYTQTPSRSGTLHSHSRSSPSATMDPSQKYIPFNQTTPAQTPISSNPKAYNLNQSHTPAGPSHSPLNLTDIRSRTFSDANDNAAGTAMLFPPYSDSATNSNYLAPFATYAYDWCKWPVMGGSGAGKMAVGSYLEDPHNFIQILDTEITPQEVKTPGAPQYGLEYTKVAEATCAYPVTRLLWEPPSSQKQSTDLLATSGDHLRLWSLPQSSGGHTSNSINHSATANTRDQPVQKLQPLALLSNSKTPEHTAPLTSLDWNTLSPKLIITSSIDTTCTIWDIPTLTAKTQLIAHDKEVFDVRFCAGSVDVFVSCGADGSVRMFDLRSLEHSTIIYEPAEKGDKASSPQNTQSPTKSSQSAQTSPPLLRLAASPHDAHLLATFASDSNIIRILDVRQPGTALLELRGHQANLNTIEWNPQRRGILASGADDSTVLIWDLMGADGTKSVLNGSGNVAGAMGAAGAAGGSGSGSAPAAGQQGEVQAKGPSASWRCEYEVANVSWAPQSALTGQGGDWLGVCAGRGVWGVKL